MILKRRKVNKSYSIELNSRVHGTTICKEKGYTTKGILKFRKEQKGMSLIVMKEKGRTGKLGTEIRE